MPVATIGSGYFGPTFRNEFELERELSFHAGGGAIFKLPPQTHFIGEVGIDTEEDYFALTGSADHTLSGNSRLRASLTVGLDDGAPDFALRGGYLVSF